MGLVLCLRRRARLQLPLCVWGQGPDWRGRAQAQGRDEPVKGE